MVIDEEALVAAAATSHTHILECPGAVHGAAEREGRLLGFGASKQATTNVLEEVFGHLSLLDERAATTLHFAIFLMFYGAWNGVHGQLGEEAEITAKMEKERTNGDSQEKKEMQRIAIGSGAHLFP
ncbi:hypothetical protein LR48_Vigan377s000700 [Vigna angularis]|nr:hypothetical protein LR48_Vigan377s000700 [Vigna angularis]BAT89810.1 hypothetical protein VIGAN_06088000 [Vigna angularis var. angularis]